MSHWHAHSLHLPDVFSLFVFWFVSCLSHLDGKHKHDKTWKAYLLELDKRTDNFFARHGFFLVLETDHQF